ncbi:MAG: hypothetical protein LBK47_10405 [Prevotellaceae bacterium]|jgi:hypothetical protein|nr:hypothetical protein [Prevotellaceae bacterium]
MKTNFITKPTITLAFAAISVLEAGAQGVAIGDRNFTPKEESYYITVSHTDRARWDSAVKSASFSLDKIFLTETKTLEMEANVKNRQDKQNEKMPLYPKCRQGHRVNKRNLNL